MVLPNARVGSAALSSADGQEGSMQRFFATTLAVVLLGTTANAQVLSSPPPRARTPVGPATAGSITPPTGPAMMAPSPMPGAGATGLSAFGLGSIFPTLGSLGPIPGTSLGAI